MQPVSCAGCQALQQRLHDLQAENERLRRRLDEATRAGLDLRDRYAAEEISCHGQAVARGRLRNEQARARGRSELVLEVSDNDVLGTLQSLARVVQRLEALDRIG